MSRAPGPKGALLWGSLSAFKADALGFLADAARIHGDVVRFRFGPVRAHLINHPEFVEHVLLRSAANYDKATRSASRIAATTGASLLSADQAAWRRHRTLIQPAFQPSCFEGIEPAIDTLLEPMFMRWEQVECIDIVDEMMQLVITVAIKILFSSDIDARRLNSALDILLADTWRRIEAPLDASLLSPRLHRTAFKLAVQSIDAMVFELIKTRRANTCRPADVLSRLLAAHEAECAAQLSDQELRDAAVTLLLAGHETTANALSWAFIHASKDLETQKPAHIFAEAIRMYPSIWIIERRAIAGDTIGGYEIPKGSSVLISPYVLHRHPEFWAEPERFDPTRFEREVLRPRHAYMPFGWGQHRCVGLHLANRIAEYVISRVFSEFRLEVLPRQSLGTTPGITLRQKSPVWMHVMRPNGPRRASK